MNWKIIIKLGNKSEALYATTRDEARQYARKVRAWAPEYSEATDSLQSWTAAVSKL